MNYIIEKNNKKGRKKANMSLKTLCMNNLVELIKNLPPLLKEEVLGESMKAIREEAKKHVIKEIRRSAVIVVEDLTDRLITSHRTAQEMKRPEYTNDLDDELYYTFTDISERFVNKHAEKIIFDNPPRNRGQQAMYWYHSDDSDQDNY
jgi:hypothetical protein